MKVTLQTKLNDLPRHLVNARIINAIKAFDSPKASKELTIADAKEFLLSEKPLKYRNFGNKSFADIGKLVELVGREVDHSLDYKNRVLTEALTSIFQYGVNQEWMTSDDSYLQTLMINAKRALTISQ